LLPHFASRFWVHWTLKASRKRWEGILGASLASGLYREKKTLIARVNIFHVFYAAKQTNSVTNNLSQF